MVTAWRLPLGMIEMAALKTPPSTVASMRPLVMRPTRLPETLRVDSVQLPARSCDDSTIRELVTTWRPSSLCWAYAAPKAVEGANRWSTWRAAGPQLRPRLRRDGERVSCPELCEQWDRPPHDRHRTHMAAIMTAARQLPVQQRERFLQATIGRALEVVHSHAPPLSCRRGG